MIDLATIILAIQLSAPSITDTTAKTYATIIEKQYRKLGTNPFTTIAIIRHESRWNAGLISKDHQDYGLMGVRAKFYGGPAVNLLNPWYNILAGTGTMWASYQFCEKHLGRAPAEQEWLQCYQTGCGKKKTRCRPTKMSTRVVAYAECLKYTIETQFSEYDCGSIYINYPT